MAAIGDNASSMTSPELTGGAGFTFEDAVVAYYLAALLNGTPAAGSPERVVHRVALQQGSFGEPLDDVIVDAVSQSDNSVARLSLQVKRALTISDAASNADFREVIQHSWETMQKADFHNDVDRVGAVTGTVAEGSFRNFVTVCELARASQTTATFMQRFAPNGNASQAHRDVLSAVRNLAPTGSNSPLSDDELYWLFRHLVLMKLDLLHEGAATDAEVVGALQRSLIATQTSRAAGLWRQLRQLARDGSGRSEEFTRGSLLNRLTGGFQFVGLPVFAGDIAILRQLARDWLLQQANDIGGTHIDRRDLHARLADEVSRHRFTLIKGLPGTGKTALLHDLLTSSAGKGPTLFLPANRLSGRSWPEFSRAIGLSNVSVEPLLVEIAATGTATLFIDGLDRIAPEQRGIVTDVLGQLVSNPVLAHWRIVATARDAGIEPLRNWLPTALLVQGGVGYVDVQNLDNDEARNLARALPALRPLLLGGDERVRSLARRPFFAAVLARGFSNATYPSGFAPSSEVDLIDAWWAGGGYNSQALHTLARQLALMDLARQSAPDLGRNLRLGSLSQSTQATFSSLEQDGLVQQVRPGHLAQFAHDIFFEWAFFQWLVDQGEAWLTTLTCAGEPPALARVVELLSQATYLDAAAWQRNLQSLQGAPMRPQWLRAWLLAPLFSPRFIEQVDAYTSTVTADDHRLLTKLLVWMQAEKTIPNPLVLSGHIGATDLPANERIRLADALGWPSDVSSWARLLNWALDRVANFPEGCLGDLVTLFETWQAAYADFANPVSERMVAQCATWLQAIEDEHQAMRGRHFHERPDDPAPQRQLPVHLETELRGLVLRAARSYPSVVTSYLSKIAQLDRFADAAFQEVMSYAPLLSQTHPERLAQVARKCFLAELPDDATARWRQEAIERRHWVEEISAIPEDQRTRRQQLALHSPGLPPSFSHHDWDRLSIGADFRGYFPASPLREPFHSLLRRAPTVGLPLVRDLVNHAVTAWRQLHRHMRPRMGTPVPLVLEFPWGPQEFWGTVREYTWFRGHGGPNAVICALMTLESWGLDELKAGKPADDVLEQVIQGHSSVAVLGIAVLLALQCKRVSAVTLPLVASQRLWRADIQRYVNEGGFRGAGLIGFGQTQADMVHRKSVADAAVLPARGLELRALVMLFAVSADEALRGTFRASLARFPQELGFEYEEEAADADHVASLRRTAELWSEWGRTENYVAAPIPGRDDVVAVELRSPRHSDPEVQQAKQRHVQMSREMELWLWVEKCFETQTWAAGFTPNEAVARAASVAGVLIDGGSTSLSDNGIAHGAIAGTAAAICCFTDGSNHQAWVDQTLATYRDEVDPRTPDHFSKSVIPWHPKIFVARALAARIRTNRGQARDRGDLYRLVVHPLEVVSLAAVNGIASCWEHDPRFAWCGLNLALRLAQLSRDLSREDYDPVRQDQAEDARRAQVLANTLAEYQAGGDYPEWVRPLPAWTQDLPRRGRSRAISDDAWYRSDDIWIGDFAAKVLLLVPVAKVMASPACERYVQALEAFVAWTMDTLNPAWRTERRGGREREGVDLIEWQHELGRVLAVVAMHLPAAEMQTRLLASIIDQPDEICMPILAPFADVLVCISVLDAPHIDERALVLLDACLDRTLRHENFRRTGYREGRIGGFDLPVLIKALLFVAIERADGAARFANGRWDDLPRVLPLVDKMVRRIGWIPFVAQEFITLCERAASCYPAGVFADQVLAQMVERRLPEGWKGTSIPARIAGLVQAYADRHHPLPVELARKLLEVLDALVDLGDRRSAALQLSEAFRGVVLPALSR